MTKENKSRLKASLLRVIHACDELSETYTRIADDGFNDAATHWIYLSATEAKFRDQLAQLD